MPSANFPAYSATFTPVNLPGNRFSSDDAVKKYQNEMGRRAAMVVELLARTDIRYVKKLPEGSQIAKLYLVAGFTQQGEGYIFGRHFSNVRYAPKNGGNPFWSASYEIVAGSDDAGFINELQRGLETGMVGVVKAGAARNIFVNRVVEEQEKIWQVHSMPGISERDLFDGLQEFPSPRLAPA